MSDLCAYCKSPINGERSTAKYCSDTCRVKYNNIPKQLQRAVDGIFERLNKLSDHLEKWPEFMVEIDAHCQDISNRCHNIQYNEINARQLLVMQRSKTQSLIFECKVCGQKVFDISATKNPCQFCKEKQWREFK